MTRDRALSELSQGSLGTEIALKTTLEDVISTRNGRVASGVSRRRTYSPHMTAPRGQILTEKSINVGPGSFSEMQDLTEIFGVSSTIDMDSSRELECSDKHCVIFLVDSTCYLLFNPVFGVTIGHGHRLISIEYFEKSGSRSGSDRYMVMFFAPWTCPILMKTTRKPQYLHVKHQNTRKNTIKMGENTRFSLIDKILKIHSRFVE